MAKKITKAIIKEVMSKVDEMSKEDCKKTFKDFNIEIGFDKSDYEEISDEDLRNIVTEELELILEDIDDKEDDAEEVKEPKKDSKPKKEKMKPKKKKAQQSEPTKKLTDGKAYILEDEDGNKLYPTLESKSVNYPIVESDVKIDVVINDNTLKAFDDGKYICLQINGRWSSILGKYMPINKTYTVVKEGVSDDIADYIDDISSGNQSESDWTPRDTKPQPVKRPKKVKKEGKPKKEDKKPVEDVKDVEPVETKKEDKPKKEKKDTKPKKTKKDTKSKKTSKKTKTTKTSKK